jgi:hypothetical protein
MHWCQLLQQYLMRIQLLQHRIRKLRNLRNRAAALRAVHNHWDIYLIDGRGDQMHKKLPQEKAGISACKQLDEP